MPSAVQPSPAQPSPAASLNGRRRTSETRAQATRHRPRQEPRVPLPVGSSRTRPRPRPRPWPVLGLARPEAARNGLTCDCHRPRAWPAHRHRRLAEEMRRRSGPDDWRACCGRNLWPAACEGRQNRIRSLLPDSFHI